MANRPLDAIDRSILYHLQEDAHQPLTNIAEALNVANNTVRNRIEKLESDGIIRRYTIDVDYSRAEIEHHYLFVCTTRVSERETLIREVRAIPGVVRVLTVMTGNQNVHVETAAATKQDIINIAYQLDELGLFIEREHLIWNDYKAPYSGFQIEENV